MQNEPIAIIGIGCRFPQANNPQEFWSLLSDGRDAIREVPAKRWNIERLYDPDPTRPGKMMSRWGGFIDQVDQFDWRAFRMLPREVRHMDPQHRLLLEVAWEALEDAGLPLSEVAGTKTSVSIGTGWNDYLRLQSRNWSHLNEYSAMGNANGFAANRLSYFFDLRGSSVSLDAGCTSSLTAIYFACQSLWTGEASLALAGGVNLILSPDSTIMVSKAGLLSPDGRCKTLDAHANGIVRGEGAGIVVLKPLSQVKRSDRVYALIRNVAVNHNGHNEWIIASNQVAQETLLRDAYYKADINPGEVDYVELHGTGFQRGDPIEVKALGAVLGSCSKRAYPCLIGSVKTNIGHLEAAAGVASVIKVALSLYHQAVPPTLNLQTIHPDIPLYDLHLAAPQTVIPWQKKETQVAGVTALAFTGANAHAVLTAYPSIVDEVSSDRETQQVRRILPLSARTEEALYAQAAIFRDFLINQTTCSWRDICYSASVRRTHHEYRLAITGHSAREAAEALYDFKRHQSIKKTVSKNSQTQPGKLLFLFAHHGSVCSELDYKYLLSEPAFYKVVEQCEQLFRQITKEPLFETLMKSKTSNQHFQGKIGHFVLQVALAALWHSWGIIPDAVLGEGLGEVAAACVAGALTLKDALNVIVHCMENSSYHKDLEAVLEEIRPGSTAIPVYSAAIESASEIQSLVSSHWKKQLEHPNLSVPAFDILLVAGYDTFIETGFPTALSGAIFARLQDQNRVGTLMSSLRHQKEANVVLLEALSTLYTLGYTVSWSAFYKEQCCYISLPTYPWQRERIWPDWLNVEEISTPPEDRLNDPQGEGAGHEIKEIEISGRSVEEVLTDLWADVLGLEKVSPQGNFFELGGHSLLAMQLLSRICTLFQVEVSLGDLLQAPTPTASAALITQKQSIRPDSRELLSLLPLIEPDPNTRYYPFPTTDIQQAYWVGRNAAFEIGNVGNHGYIEVEAIDLDLDRFKVALQRLIDRHDMLRAILLSDGQQQVLEYVPPFEMNVVDLRGQDPQAMAIQLEDIRRSMDHQLLPVEQWPAFEICLSRLDDRRIRLHLSVESLFIDAWSMNTLIQEFIRFYHEPDVYLPLELSFRDYVLAEQKLHDSELYRRSEKYWSQRISSLPPAPDLPLAHSFGSQAQPHFVHREARLTTESWTRLKSRAGQVGLTPSGVLLTAFSEVLATWSKSSRFSINLSTFNRLPLHPQVNLIVGDFTSLLVLAIDNSVPDSFENRAKRLQQQLWNDLDHSYYSGIRVLRELAKAQGRIATAIMPVVFTSLLIQDTASPYPPPWQNTVYCVSQTPQVWLDHQVLESAGELVLHWQSVDAMFPEGLIDAMFDAYCHLLQRLATIEESWHEVTRQTVPQWQIEQRAKINATGVPVCEKLLHTFFLEQVSQRPDQIAVISPTRRLTYKEIYSGALQLAHQLRQWGVVPNQLVAVVMEKGWEQIVAVVGVLQSGAAYLPVDAGLPKERQMYLLEHGEVEIILTQSWVDSMIQWPEHFKRICVDSLDMSRLDIPPLVPAQGPEDLAYVIYTSGSTGLPKGVMIDHRGAVNTVLDINQRFGVSCNDRVLALSALNFDLSVYDIFGMLAISGTIVLPVKDTLRHPDSWLEILVQEQVTIWNSVPALLEMFVEYVEAQPEVLKNTCLRLVLLSGDWIPVSLPDRLRKLIPEVDIVSLGGATEASIWSILYPITTIEPSWKSIPYGRPMLNQRFSVLSEILEPCPIWVPGQLYISGIGLAKGYWRDEKKTQSSFFYHPRTGERLYRTGDLGRYLPDGNIEFLGREDFQVKILGHRVELGEIEETLLQHPAVRAAVAIVSEPSHSDKQLVAYVVLRSEQDEASNGHSTLTQSLKEETSRSYTLQQLRGQLYGNEGNYDSAFDTIHENGRYAAFEGLELMFGQASARRDLLKPTIELAHTIPDADTRKKYGERLSYRQFLSEPLSFAQFSHFLGVLRQIELGGLPKYRYPSAGGIYPVQIYLYIKPDRIPGLAEGIYYYNPQSHQLIVLSEGVHLTSDIHASINQFIFEQSAFSLFLIGDLTTITSQYGNAARDFCLLEAGYMSQLLMNSAPAYDIGLCPVGGLNFDSIRDLFCLEESHVCLHSLLCGRVDSSTSTGWSFLPENLAISSALPSTPAASVSTTSTALRSFLREKLPDYMVPSAIMILERLPLTPNGKVDRKNLPAPDLFSNKTEKAFVAPQSEVEKTIASVWQEMLPSKMVGIHDNFFDLGGNSLLMVRAYTKLRKILTRDISIVEMFFEYPTIHALTEFLTSEENSQHALQEKTEQRHQRIEIHKGLVRQHRQVRRKQHAAERNQDHA